MRKALKKNTVTEIGESNDILHLAADVGQIILENGGETYRVEQTINSLCKAFGMKETDSFALPTGIILTVIDKEGKTYSMVRRIMTRTINLEKISRINTLIRSLEKDPDIEYIKREIRKIAELKHYPTPFLFFAAGMSASFFTLVFGGTWNDFVVAFPIGVIVKVFTHFADRMRFNQFFNNVIGGAIASFLSLLCVFFGIATNSDKMIIGTIMLLVPGITIVNAIRDTMAGDLVAGISRIIDAVIVAIAIAAGTGIILTVWLLVFKGLHL